MEKRINIINLDGQGVYISKNKKSIAMPYWISLLKGEIKIQEFFNCGVCLSEWTTIESFQKRYKIIKDYNFTVENTGLIESEIYEYFNLVEGLNDKKEQSTI